MSQQAVSGVHAAATNWAALGALAAWVTVGVYIALGLFAWRQVREARKLREEQARPFVMVDFDAGFVVYLTVENLGRTMAHEVCITFDKPLESSLRDPAEIEASPLFREPIPALPPGKKIRVLFDSFDGRVEAKLPMVYEVTLRYKGPTGRRAFEERYPLDLGIYRGSMLPQKGMPEIAAELESIRKEIKKWTGDGGHGVLVHARDQERKDRIGKRRVYVLVFRRQGPKALARMLWQQAKSRLGLR